MQTYNIRKLICLLAVTASLGACSTTGVMHNKEQDTASKLDLVLEKAANDAYMRGDKKDSLILIERIYKRNSNNPDAAIKYSKALRQNNHFQKASAVLSPFIYGENATNELLTEYAYLQTAMGNYNLAKDTAMRVLENDENAFKAKHAIGIALDAKGHHKQAEEYFRAALEIWEGDPIPLLNNLALSLASQGYLDDSVNLLQKATKAAPNRMEIQRNLRIITTLQQSTNRILMPKPIKKSGKS